MRPCILRAYERMIEQPIRCIDGSVGLRSPDRRHCLFYDAAYEYAMGGEWYRMRLLLHAEAVPTPWPGEAWWWPPLQLDSPWSHDGRYALARQARPSPQTWLFDTRASGDAAFRTLEHGGVWSPRDYRRLVPGGAHLLIDGSLAGVESVVVRRGREVERANDEYWQISDVGWLASGDFIWSSSCDRTANVLHVHAYDASSGEPVTSTVIAADDVGSWRTKPLERHAGARVQRLRARTASRRAWIEAIEVAQDADVAPPEPVRPLWLPAASQ